MKIGILSRHPELYSTRRLVEAAQERGHSVRVVDYLRCYMNIAAHRPLIMLGGKALELDGVVPRIGASHTFYGTAVVRQLEMMGAVSANSSQGIARSRDELRCLQLLSRAGVDLPVTGFASSAKDIDSLLEIVGGAPLVVKLLRGTQYGVGTILAETRAAAESVIEAFGGLKANILVQEYIHEEEGADIRAFVVGNKVVAAMRWKTEEDPGPNLQRVGKARRIKLSPDERKMAIRAAKIAGLSVAGVDLLRTHRGPLVMEVNSSPDIEGIERATSVDVAGKIIELLEKQAAASGAKA